MKERFFFSASNFRRIDPEISSTNRLLVAFISVVAVVVIAGTVVVDSTVVVITGVVLTIVVGDAFPSPLSISFPRISFEILICFVSSGSIADDESWVTDVVSTVDIGWSPDFGRMGSVDLDADVFSVFDVGSIASVVGSVGGSVLDAARVVDDSANDD